MFEIEKKTAQGDQQGKSYIYKVFKGFRPC